jgi:hypothetical protein
MTSAVEVDERQISLDGSIVGGPMGALPVRSLRARF